MKRFHFSRASWNRYRTFDQAAVGKILGTVLSLISGHSSQKNYRESGKTVGSRELEDKLRFLDSEDFQRRIEESRFTEDIVIEGY